MVIHLFTGDYNKPARLFKSCIPLLLAAVALLASPAALPEEATESAATSDQKMDAILLELKAIRQVLACDAALYVVDARDRVLGKHRDELEILGRCARPVVPVLNFTASTEARTAECSASRSVSTPSRYSCRSRRISGWHAGASPIRPTS